MGDAGGKLEAANTPDRSRETGPKGGGQPAETAPAGQPSAGRGGGETGSRWEECKGQATQGHRVKWGRAARGDRVGVPVERQEKEEKTGRSAKYEATCEPKGAEGKGYESPEQDHRECCEPKERKWGEGAQEWEGRERQPNVQRAREDGHCASKEEQGQEGKYWAKRNGESEGWSKWDAGKRKK